MNTTPVSLLERLRQPAEQQAWEEFVELYTPLLFFWTRRLGLASAEAADLVQDVFTVLVQAMPEFRYDKQKSFRGWLKTILTNRWRNRRRRPAEVSLDAAAVPAVPPRDADSLEEREYRQYLVGRALELMQAEFEPSTWKACWELVVAGRPAAEVAATLGLTVNAVYLAKSRVLRRLRQELDGLLD